MKRMTTGFYIPTENFKSIPEHIAVMNEDDQGLIALVGAADEAPEVVQESMECARLFAKAPELLEELNNLQIHYHYIAGHSGESEKCNMPYCFSARAAIAKATED